MLYTGRVELPLKLNFAYDALDPSEIEIQRAEFAHKLTYNLYVYTLHTETNIIIHDALIFIAGNKEQLCLPIKKDIHTQTQQMFYTQLRL